MVFMGVQEQTAPAKGSSTPVDYPTFLTRLGTKDRLNVERHLATAEAEIESAHASNYRRLVCLLAALAPAPAKTHGQQAVQFYIPDGKYRMQVFAVHDARDGVIIIYSEDVLDAAIKSQHVSGPHEVAGATNSYRIRGSIDSIKIDRLDGKSINPQPFYKDMLGWNRRGLRLTIPANATPHQVEAVEHICALAAKRWIG